MGWQDAPVVESGGWQSAPEVQPEKSALRSAVEKGARGFLQMGPVGAAAAMTGAAADQVGKLTERAGYEAGGKVTDVTGSPAAGYATNVAVQAIPTILSGEVAKGVTAPALDKTAKYFMRSALKAPLSELRKGNTVRGIQTMLDDGINVSEGGVAKLKGMIGQLNKEVTQAIAASDKTVHKGQVASELQKVVNRFEKQVNPGSDLKAIEMAWDEFVNHPLLTGEQIQVKLAHEMKQATQRAVADKFGQLGTASEEAQKALAYGLRKGVAEAEPEAAKLLSRESELINALNLTERRALMQLNNNPAGLSLLASNPQAAAAFMADRSALFKSLISRMLYQGQRTIPGAVASGTAAAVTAEGNAP